MKADFTAGLAELHETLAKKDCRARRPGLEARTYPGFDEAYTQAMAKLVALEAGFHRSFSGADQAAREQRVAGSAGGARGVDVSGSLAGVLAVHRGPARRGGGIRSRGLAEQSRRSAENNWRGLGAELEAWTYPTSYPEHTQYSEKQSVGEAEFSWLYLRSFSRVLLGRVKSNSIDLSRSTSR